MSMTKILRAGLMSGAAVVVMSGAAFAADLGGSLKDTAEAKSDYTIAVNGGLTTDYVFRGISQSDNDPAVFAGADLAYKMFYVGVWASSVDDATSGGNLEIDVYGGIKKSYRGIDFDLGLIYYGYPSQGPAFEENRADYLELKAAASTKILNDLTVTGTVFWSPDYYAETGSTVTVEGKVSKPLPWFGLTASGTLGYVTSDNDGDRFSSFYGADDYTYWNVGLSKTFREHFTVDVRYWGTDVDKDAPASSVADDRIVGTLTFSY